MKNIKILAFIPILVGAGLTGCKNKKETNPWETYHEEYLYNQPVYEPLDVSVEGNYPASVVVINLPEEGIPQTKWDDYDIKLRCVYDNTQPREFNLKEVNIPIPFRHYLGEVGEHEIEIKYDLMPLKWNFKIIENPDWKGFNCYFFDMENNLIHTQGAQYYECITYSGELPKPVETLEYEARFTKWNRSLEYICQTMQFKAQSKQFEKRDYARIPVKYHHKGIGGIDDIAKQKGSTTIYLGRLYRTAALTTEVQEYDGKDLSFKLPENDLGEYYNKVNEIARDHIKYIEVPEFTPYMYGSIPNMISTISFNNVWDSRFRKPSDMMVVELEDGVQTTLSAIDPHTNVINMVTPYIGKEVTVEKAKLQNGYYRYSVIMDFDVYLTYSYKRIGEREYEIDAFNYLTVCPVIASQKEVLQYSETPEFHDEFNKTFEIDTEWMWFYAKSHNWGEWHD